MPAFVYGQDIVLADVWHFRQGDFDATALRDIEQKQRIDIDFMEVVAIQFTTKSADNLQYRILGADNYAQWRDIGQGGVLQMPTLNGGEFLLEVKTTRPASKPYRLAIHIEQPFWQRRWFWPSIWVYTVFLVGIAIYFFLLYDIRQKLRVEEIRNKIAADLHDEVGSNLNSIAIYVELLRRKAPVEFTEILDRITNNSVESVQLMQDTIWAIQVKNDDMSKFITRMKSFAAEMLSAKSIALDFESEQPNKMPNLPMEQRKNVYLIFKEAISNIAKHSKATKANVKWTMNHEQCRITVMDNGRGFDTTQIYNGNGLNNFITRAEASEMKVNVSSVIGEGTKIEIVAAL